MATLIIDTNRNGLKNATEIEQILCLASLIAAKILRYDATIQDADDYYKNIKDCNECPLKLNCLASEIN